MLDGLPVLIVEDDVFIGLTLADAVEHAGGLVIGPVGTTTIALDLLATTQVGAAILNVNLADRDIEPVLNSGEGGRHPDRGSFGNRADAPSGGDLSASAGSTKTSTAGCCGARTCR